MYFPADADHRRRRRPARQPAGLGAAPLRVFSRPLRGRRAPSQRDGQRTRSDAVQPSGAPRDWRGRIGGRRPAVSMGCGRAVCGPRRQGLGRGRDRRLGGGRCGGRITWRRADRAAGERRATGDEHAAAPLAPSAPQAGARCPPARAGSAAGGQASGRRRASGAPATQARNRRQLAAAHRRRGAMAIGDVAADRRGHRLHAGAARRWRRDADRAVRTKILNRSSSANSIGSGIAFRRGSPAW